MQIMQRQTFAFALLLAAWLPATRSAGQETPAAPSGPAVDPKADAVFKQACEHLAAAKSFRVVAYDTADQTLDTGHRVQLSSERRFSIRRPDRVFVESTGDAIHRCSWYDGKTLTLLDTLDGVYGVVDTPDTIDKALDLLAEKYGVTFPLADLLLSDPYGMTMPAVRSGRYVGQHGVHGRDCHHLTFVGENVDWQVWVQADGEPLIRKIVITYRNVPGAPQYVAILEEWDLAAQLDDATFAFTAPEGVTKIAIEPIIRATPDAKGSD
jgi:hypothetical protein